MRTVLLAGTAAAVVWLVAGYAIKLLNQPSDRSVAAGYFLLVGLVAAAVGVGSRLTKRSKS